MGSPDIGIKLAELSTKFDIMLSNQKAMSALLDRLDKEKQGLEKQLIKLSNKLDNIQNCEVACDAPKRVDDLEKRTETLEKWFFRSAIGFALALLSGVLSWIGLKFGK